MSRFEVYRDSVNEYRWRLKADNNEIIADSSEGYVAKNDCLGGLQVLKDMAGSFQTYSDARGEYRWRFRANNGRIVADSGEGYTTESSCNAAVERVKKEAPNAPIDDLT